MSPLLQYWRHYAIIMHNIIYMHFELVQNLYMDVIFRNKVD